MEKKKAQRKTIARTQEVGLHFTNVKAHSAKETVSTSLNRGLNQYIARCLPQHHQKS